MLIYTMSAFLLGAVIYDFLNHRLPNYFLLLGFLVSLFLQAFSSVESGVASALLGAFVGFALFVPFYAIGGMAAGDVKLMAVIGSFVGSGGVFWAAAFSLIAGSIFGVLYLLCKKQLGSFVARYMAMEAMRFRIEAAPGDAARHRFPYALAIAVGTLTSLYWTPF